MTAVLIKLSDFVFCPLSSKVDALAVTLARTPKGETAGYDQYFGFS